MISERPDLSGTPPEVREYIKSLEEKIQLLLLSGGDGSREQKEPEQSEPPTTINILTISQTGVIKRTPRHLYGRQRRGGMGIFDLDVPEEDSPKILVSADNSETLLVLTEDGRVYHLPVNEIDESPVRSKGSSLHQKIGISPSVKIVHVSPLSKEQYLGMLSERGYVRILRHNYVNTNIRHGTQIMDAGRFGLLINANWLNLDDDLLVLTRQGLGIRFSSKKIHPTGTLGIRLEKDDFPVSVCGVTDETNVFMVGGDGKGTIRNMAGFRANKASGSGGKILFKSDEVTAGFNLNLSDDIFIISKLSKIIRFQAEEIPVKEGVVQGVNCMSLRADQCIAALSSRAISNGYTNDHE